MKKYLMTLCLTILFTNSLSAFEFKGVKSGMSLEEVTEVVGTEISYSGKTLDDEEASAWLPLIKPYEVEFLFNKDKKLWRLTIVDHQGSVTSSVGRKNALKKVCDTVDEDRLQLGSGSYKYWVNTYKCFFIDSKLFDEDVKHYEKLTLEAWK